MVRALASFLYGRDFPNLGMRRVMPPLTATANRLPRRARAAVYGWGGWSEGLPARRLSTVNSEAMSRWVVGQYPARRYPAVLVGSSNGAAVHLGAALGIPWLPQTLLLLPRRSGIDPDDPLADFRWAREPAARLLAVNPALQLHHMHDPNQDRLMLRHVTYFRVKRRTLGATYEAFLASCLQKGGTIILVECQRNWPTTAVSERHVFQPGAVGGLSPDDYLRGSPRVDHYLRRQGSPVRRWQQPAPDGTSPEAEWGFEPALRRDVERFASRHGYRVRRLVFEEPEDLSGVVADLYRWWYARRGIAARRLVVESFMLLEPWWILRTASVPFWTLFSVQPSVQRLVRYLDAAPYDDVRVMLFSHGVESAGIASVDDWRSAMDQAGVEGGFVGVDERAFPRDFSTFVRYHEDLRQLPDRIPMPSPMGLPDLDAFLDSHDIQHMVRMRDNPLPGSR